MLVETQRLRRGHAFLPPRKILNKIPKLYETEDMSLDEKMVWIRYFGGAGTWYVVELADDQDTAFGYCDLGVGYPEWGYMSISEMEQVNVHGGLVIVERDMWFEPCPVSSIPEIQI